MMKMNTRFKIFVFFQFGAFGVYGSYLPLFFYNRNFSGFQVGLLLGTMPIVVLGLQPVWSYLSDRLNARKALLLISCLGMGLAMFGLGLSKSYVAAFIWIVLFAAFSAPIIPIGTAMLLEYLEESDELDNYSLFRVWGSVGFAIISMVVGSLFLGENTDYLVWLTGGIYILLGLVGLTLPEKRNQVQHSETKVSEILSGNPRLVFFLIGSVFIGASLVVYNNNITLFLQSLKAQDWLVGLTISLQAVVEIPLMLLVPLALKHRSPRWVILMGAVLLPLRWLIYFFVKTPGWVVPSQVIHGVAVVSFYVVGIGFVDQLVNPRWRATGQGLYSASLNGIGAALGAYLAGAILEWFGIRAVWGVNIILGAIGLAFLLLALYPRQKDETQPSQ
ncbi:MAG TPA: MFS transporter [Brevefilum sp.]|nr:MFS transporter [Brevefilum sp.]